MKRVAYIVGLPSRLAGRAGAGRSALLRRWAASGGSDWRSRAAGERARGRRRPRLSARQHRRLGRRAASSSPCTPTAIRRRRCSSSSTASRGRIPNDAFQRPAPGTPHFQSPLAVRIDRQGRLWVLDYADYGRGQPRLLAFDLDHQRRRPSGRLPQQRGRLSLDAERLPGRSGGREDLHRRDQPVPAAPGADRLRQRAQDEPPAARGPSVGGDRGLRHPGARPRHDRLRPRTRCASRSIRSRSTTAASGSTTGRSPAAVSTACAPAI